MKMLINVPPHLFIEDSLGFEYHFSQFGYTVQPGWDDNKWTITLEEIASSPQADKELSDLWIELREKHEKRELPSCPDENCMGPTIEHFDHGIVK